MSKPGPSILSIETMHSGRACLNLTSHIEWEDFPLYALRLLEPLKGYIINKSDAVDIRVWDVAIEQEIFRLTFDDFPVMVSLEASTPAGDLLLAKLKIKLGNLDL